MAKNTYKNIIKNSMKLFAEMGYDASSMSKIAEKSGVSKSDLYHHFKNKEDLLIKTCEYAWMNTTAKELFGIDGLNRGNFQKELIKRGERYIKGLRKDIVRKKLAMALMPVMIRNQNIMKKLMPTADIVLNLASELIDKGIKQGAVSKRINKKLIVQEMFMMLDAIEMYIAFDVPFDLEGIWEDFIYKSIR